MGENKKIQILLSTYNGERYLREQLDSYLSLKNYDEISVLIRDDGSTDGTWHLLEEYAKRYSFQIKQGEHKGINFSYQWLLENSSSECSFFAFSDQDDVWLPEKLFQAVTALEQLPQSIPLLYASRSIITSENLCPIGYSTSPLRGISFYNAMIQNVLPGHTQVFNSQLRDELRDHGILEAHVVDWWAYLTASARGKIIFSEEYQVLHRQHSRNAVGYQLGAFKRFWKKLSYLRSGKGNAISRQLKAFAKIYNNELPQEYQQELNNYLEGLGNFSCRLNYLKKSRVYRQEKKEDWKFRLLYLVGKYDL